MLKYFSVMPGLDPGIQGGGDSRMQHPSASLRK
jgi:hypothetical protein